MKKIIYIMKGDNLQNNKTKDDFNNTINYNDYANRKMIQKG